MAPKQNRQGRRKTPRNKNVVTKASLNGSVLRVGPDPTPIVLVPWNPIVVALEVPAVPPTNTTVLRVTDTDILNQLIAQLGLTNAIQTGFLSYRVQQIRVWGTSGSRIKLDVTATTGSGGGGNIELATIEDVAPLTARPSVGYMWPLTYRTEPHGDSNRVMFILTYGANESPVTEPTAVIHLHLTWRSDPQIPTKSMSLDEVLAHKTAPQ